MGRALNGPTVAVVGAGWAGCAAAAELARNGARVILFEASADLGGRARRVHVEMAGTRHRLDNGQHLLLGAYRATAALLAVLGIELDSVIERQPFALRYADGFRLCAGPWRAPWHLASALVTSRGLSVSERIDLLVWLHKLERDGWRIGADRAADAWLHSSGQSARIVARVWRPLLLAALNTPPARASAQVFANVLRDSLGATADASHFWLPRTDLSALLPEAVERYLLERGGEVRRNARVDSVERIDARFLVALRTQPAATMTAQRVVYAATPAHLSQVVRAHAGELDDTLRIVERFVYEPIVTIYLKYPRAVRLPHPALALCEDTSQRRWGQWVFDRGALDASHEGVLAAVISASGAHQARALDELCADVAEQLRFELGLPVPLGARAIVEKRATLAAVPGLQRPRAETAVPGLVLAGDWTDSDYPSTLETAVRSGIAAAQIVLAMR